MQILIDGVHEVAYFEAEQPEAVAGTVLAICRHGTLTGSDPHGGVFFGKLLADPRTAAGTADFVMTYDVPPDGELVTGFVAGGDGATVHIAGRIRYSDLNSRSTVMIEGDAIHVAISYLGPLPD